MSTFGLTKLLILECAALMFGAALVLTTVTLHLRRERQVILEQHTVGPGAWTLDGEC